MLKALKILYSGWVMATFMCITVPVLILYAITAFIPYRYQIRLIFFINRAFVFVWSLFVGLRFRVRGTSHIAKGRNYVVIMNHLNIADMIALAYGLRVPAKTLIKKELLYIPFLGQMFGLACLPMDRSSKKARHASKVRLLKDLKAGISVLIFPEGTRNRSKGPLLPFYDGAFELALEAQVPILPVVLTNTKKINRVGTLLFQPGTLEITHLTPIITMGKTIDQLDEIKQRAFDAMHDYIIRHDDYFNTQKKDNKAASAVSHAP
jgi:1-acyl-sn-glycerol-3-phosphate acyltransferase